MLIPLYLVSHGLLNKPSLYLSDFFERNRASYYDALMQVRTNNNVIHWLRFFLNGVAETATRGRDLFREILALRAKVEQDVLGLGKRAPLAREALNVLYRQPIVNAKQLETALDITTPTANALIKALMGKGILVEMTGQQRWRSYVFDPYLKLFLS